MKVHELIEKLQEFDPELDVEFTYTVSEGCCSWNSYESTEERDVESVYEATTTEWRDAPGPRGGPVKRRQVEVPIVRLGE